MKKNKMMRTASVLLVLVVLTTSIISGTLAKYTTKDSASDSARVAKWGVELAVVGDLYEGAYATGDLDASKPVAWTAANATGVSVNAAAKADVVAPGTKNEEGFKFSLKGTPEVSGKITTKIAYENIYLKAGTYGVMVEYGTIEKAEYDTLMASAADEDKLYTKDATGKFAVATAYAADTTYYTLEDKVTLNADYYPVQYSLTGTGGATVAAAGTDTDTLAEVVKGMTKDDALGTKKANSETTEAGKTTVTYEKEFTPNTDLATSIKLGDECIKWEWKFTDATAGSTVDGADTILGNLQAGDLNVVKATTAGGTTTYAAPTAATGTNAGDYNLETCFGLDITVEQTD